MLNFIKHCIFAACIGIGLGYLTYPIVRYYIPNYDKNSIIPNSVYYSIKQYDDWFIFYKVFSHPERKIKFLEDPKSNVIVVETKIDKTTFWTYILPE